MLCAVIPTLNSETHLPMLLAQLSRGAERLVVSDGGSEDNTVQAAIKSGSIITAGGIGRGHQLARGASWSGDADWLLFLHCDNELPQDWENDVADHIANHFNKAAYFRYRANAAGFWPRFMDFWVGMRCFWWGLPYGDQGLLISKQMYEAIGGYKEIPLFEDVAIIDSIKALYGRRALRSLGGYMKINVQAYKSQGFWTRGRRNLGLVKAYRRGEDIAALAETYRKSA